ncbi:reverse transcriptase domain-containing protein [Tanacetum coccineum]
MFGSEGLSRRTMMKFTVVQVSSLYNIILGRTGMRELHAISSTTHAMMKFPTLRGIATLVPRRDTIFECRKLEGKHILFEEQPKKEVEGAKRGRVRLEIGGYGQSPKADKSTFSERESKYQTGSTKAKGTRSGEEQGCYERGCGVDQGRDSEADFKNLNSACPKDYYPLPEIDLKIEAVMGFPFKFFLDAYKGYHQIQMSEEDEEKTAFYIDQGTYCYTKMSFDLKNARATYQQLVDSAFQTQLRRNLEAYVDDMVIKSKTERDTIMDIAETFDNLRKVNMKLNLKRCSFGVKDGEFLGYIVTSEGIRANPKKTKAVADMQSLKTLKEMQSLSGKLMALNRFLS